MFLNRDRVAKVTPADVQRVAQKYLIESNRTVSSFIPTEKTVRAEVLSLIDAEIVARVKDYTAMRRLLVKLLDPSPKNHRSPHG